MGRRPCLLAGQLICPISKALFKKLHIFGEKNKKGSTVVHSVHCVRRFNQTGVFYLIERSGGLRRSLSKRFKNGIECTWVLGGGYLGGVLFLGMKESGTSTGSSRCCSTTIIFERFFRRSSTSSSTAAGGFGRSGSFSDEPPPLRLRGLAKYNGLL